jgi:transposase
MAQVLCVYQAVALLRERAETDHLLAILSYDEKPGIQAIETTGREKAPVPGQYSTWLRDYEYVRHGTLSLLAGIDLLDGHVHGLVCERHRSAEFIEFLKRVDAYYPPETRIRLILDNHSSHLSRETRAYLNSVPNRFEFIFTPKHASWLNLIETFFAKMAKTVLRGIRVRSKEELRIRLEQYLAQVNESPVIFRWTHGLASAESIS